MQGPFDLLGIRQLVASGKLTRQTPIIEEDGDEWVSLELVEKNNPPTVNTVSQPTARNVHADGDRKASSPAPIFSVEGQKSATSQKDLAPAYMSVPRFQHQLPLTHPFSHGFWDNKKILWAGGGALILLGLLIFAVFWKTQTNQPRSSQSDVVATNRPPSDSINLSADSNTPSAAKTRTKSNPELEHLTKNLSQAQTQREMNIASAKLAELWDRRLLDIERRLGGKINADLLPKFEQSRKAWRSYRSSEVAFRAGFNEGGSIYPLIANTMHASVTSLRVDDLETLLNDLSEQ